MSDLSRRLFLKQSLLVAGSSLLLTRLRALPQEPGTESDREDEEICKRKFRLADEQSLRDQPIGEVIKAIGMSFIGTPYLAHGLETPGDEQLVVNLRGLDCVSLTESTLALSRCVKLGKRTFDEFKNQLQRIRYREGIINKYPSRLHYFSDWIDNNTKKGIVRDVTRTIGGQRYSKTVNYMTTHRDSYRQLSDEGFVAMIKRTEEDLTKRVHFYVPKSRISRVQRKIKTGDIIAITASMEGMDIAHTGMAVWIDGVLRFLHAPIVGSVVQVTEKPLAEYLQAHKSQTGVMVARPLEPQS